MAWEDNRNKSPRDISKEERLKWLREQIMQMEAKCLGNKPMHLTSAEYVAMQRAKPRIRRNGKWVE